jgi:hypothetical protein
VEKLFYADKTFRPFARLRLITNRPFLVAIRARNPWDLLRFITLGWNVLFIGIYQMALKK